MKFTKEQLQEAVDKSKSFNEVMKALSIEDKASFFISLKREIKKNKISVDHFDTLTKNANSGMPSEEDLRKAVAECRSMSQLMRHFNKNPNSSGSRVPFEMMIDKLKIDRSHWKGQRSTSQLLMYWERNQGFTGFDLDF